MSVRFAHTNIVCVDWRGVAAFYEQVFGCTPVPPERSLSGGWLDRATGVKDAVIEGIHLRVPGHGDAGPTLEIFSYERMEERPQPVANRQGFSHIAFGVDDVQECLDRVLAHGGSARGEIVVREIPGVGTLAVVYAADPEGNIVELQQWSG